MFYMYMFVREWESGEEREGAGGEIWEVGRMAQKDKEKK